MSPEAAEVVEAFLATAEPLTDGQLATVAQLLWSRDAEQQSPT